MRNPHAGEPFDTPDEEIAEALLDVSASRPCCSRWSTCPATPSSSAAGCRPAGLFLNEVQGYMSEEDKAEARALALEVIRDYRDRGCPEPAPIAAELLHEMMAWLVCEEVPDEYVPDADGGDGARRARRPAGRSGRPTPAARDAFPVVVIGCGQSGLLAGIRLKEAGIPFTIVEKNAGVGGTWWENSYPGARVDVGNHFYCYSFEPSDHWTEYFARQPELQALLRAVMDKHGIGPPCPLGDRGPGGHVGRRSRHLVGRHPDADGTDRDARPPGP